MPTHRVGLYLLFLIFIGLIAAACSSAPARTSLPTSRFVTLAAPPTEAATTIMPAGGTKISAPLSQTPTQLYTNTPVATVTSAPSATATPQLAPSPTVAATLRPTNPITTVIGFSAEGRPIVSYQFGEGLTQVILVGGIHGGYEWNTILLAYDMIDYFQDHQAAVPASITLHIVPAANPDGQFAVTNSEGRFEVANVAADTVPGRFNGRGVDLNRNWDCNWSETAVWRDHVVSGGSEPFSEPESQALRDFFLQQQPQVVVFWHSAANGVFAAGCPTLFEASWTLTNIYGEAAGYPVYPTFSSYPITGDAGDWLATIGIPAISIELSTHQDLDWSHNLAGVLALLDYYDRPVR